MKAKDLRLLMLGCGFVFCILSFAIPQNSYAQNLDSLKVYFLKADYKSAITEGEKLLASYKSSSYGLDKLYYILGLSYMKDGNLLRASDIFEIIIKELRDSPLKDDATLSAGDTCFLMGDYEKAKTYYKQLVDVQRQSNLKPIAYSRLSECAFKQGLTAEGKEYLDKLNREYPLNFEIKLTRGISAPSDFYTVQVGSFGNSENASNLFDKLKSYGYDAYIEETVADGKKLYRVRVGKLSTRREAILLEDKLSTEGYPTKVFP